MTTPLAERYRHMPEQRLLQIALHEAAGLTPETLAVLRAELAARGVATWVDRAVQAQTRPLAPGEVDALVEAIRKWPCPECGSAERPLNGAEIAEAKSFVLLTAYEKQLFIACPDCLSRRARQASAVTAALGWWGLPLGPIQSVQALWQNARVRHRCGREEPSAALRAFVEANPDSATAWAEGAV